MYASLIASPKSEGIILTVRELFVLVALVAVFIWIAWEVVKTTRR
jgi:hypothetical protein